MTQIEATVCIGWRPIQRAGGPARGRTFDFLHEVFLPKFERIAIATDDKDLRDEPFNRSLAKNNAAAFAKKVDGADPNRVLVFADADTYAPVHQVEFAVRAITENGADLCLAHNGTALYMNEGLLRGNGIGGIVGPFPGGVFAIRRSAFEAMGGWDERFLGWGHEDLCFLNSADRIFGLKIMMSNDPMMGPFFKLDMAYPRLVHESELMDPANTSIDAALYRRNSARRDAYFALEARDRLGYWDLRHRDVPLEETS